MMRNTKREEYVEALRTVLSAREEVDSLEYFEIMDEEGLKEYMRLTLVTGTAGTYDVTGLDNAHIFHIIALIELNQKVSRKISDKDELIRLSKMFRR